MRVEQVKTLTSKSSARTRSNRWYPLLTFFLFNSLIWAHVDSNHGPQLYQSCALTN
jgi:hypothetical protein